MPRLLIDTTLNVRKYHLEERSPDDVKLAGDPMRLSQEKYDVVIIGGGIAGNALATVLARTRRAVLVPERSTLYWDKVRGEVFHAWGVAEAPRARRLMQTEPRPQPVAPRYPAGPESVPASAFDASIYHRLCARAVGREADRRWTARDPDAAP